MEVKWTCDAAYLGLGLEALPGEGEILHLLAGKRHLGVRWVELLVVWMSFGGCLLVSWWK